jgi:glycolate oxidase iron-sulfur subunit
VTRATERVLRSLGLEPVRVEGEGCCGALNHHLGQEGAANRRASALCRDVASSALNGPLAGLVTTATGCGAAIRDFGHHLATREAQATSGMTVDVMQFASARMPGSVQSAALPLKVAYHFPCSLQHSMKGVEHGPTLLRRLGFEVVELKDRTCCGSAGTYSILQPEIAGTLEKAKMDEVSSISPDVIVSGNIGCMSQLSKSAKVAVLHPIELVDWALSGASPEEIRNRLRVEPASAHST